MKAADKETLRKLWNYRSEIVKRIDAQTLKGIEKYGQTLESNPAKMAERLEHLAQELTDGLAYIEWVKDASEEQKSEVCLSFPHLHPKLYYDILAQVLQVTEESGELAEKVGILTDTTGKRKPIPDDIAEQVVKEALDTAQAACGVAYAVARIYEVDLGLAMKQHIEKMKKRGYLDNGN